MSDAPRPRRFLVLACSATKRPDPGRIAARQRYDGPLWRTLRATDPDDRLARVAFLSARFGFRDARTAIEDYDAKLTERLAERMIAGGVTTRCPMPPPRALPDTFGVHAGAEIASITRHQTEPIEDVALVGGQLYLRVMRELLKGFRDMGAIQPEASIAEINGPIGRMRQDLRRWLLDGAGTAEAYTATTEQGRYEAIEEQRVCQPSPRRARVGPGASLPCAARRRPASPSAPPSIALSRRCANAAQSPKTTWPPFTI